MIPNGFGGIQKVRSLKIPEFWPPSPPAPPPPLLFTLIHFRARFITLGQLTTDHEVQLINEKVAIFAENPQRK